MRILIVAAGLLAFMGECSCAEEKSSTPSTATSAPTGGLWFEDPNRVLSAENPYVQKAREMARGAFELGQRQKLGVDTEKKLHEFWLVLGGHRCGREPAE